MVGVSASASLDIERKQGALSHFFFFLSTAAALSVLFYRSIIARSASVGVKKVMHAQQRCVSSWSASVVAAEVAKKGRNPQHLCVISLPMALRAQN
mmetsp:Transcript_16224/g.35175  ORF Transcript_16224/g.35175 Transcript_16224/m.35175 type:complete len:96 (+) Transcript_16224:2020-2307(+)